MAEIVRSIVGSLRRFVGNRRRSARYTTRLPFSVSLAGAKPAIKGAQRPPALSGFTRDLSTDGLALIVPSILIGEYHLIGEGRALLVSLNLPSGPIELEALAIRYERLDEEETERGYLIGAHITKINDHDRQRLDQYINGLKKA